MGQDFFDLQYGWMRMWVGISKRQYNEAYIVWSFVLYTLSLYIFMRIAHLREAAVKVLF